ncbi:MAG: T9SS type A sorting domain-containing protein [Ignavibacterium sp.]|nr:T9SS type A sorting domain-containing protein [Ignavibacterium sp.]
MNKSFSLLCFVIINCISNSFSQSDNSGVLLYSQTGLVSDYVSLPSYKNINNVWEQVADDFAATSDWVIDRMVVMCDYIDTASTNGFSLYIYNDDNGIPGTLIYSAETQPYAFEYLNYFAVQVTISLDTPAGLKPGRYWISVQLQESSGNSHWYWTQANENFGSTAQFRNYSAYCASWSPIWHCLGTSYTDMYFELYGTTVPVDVKEINIISPSTFSLDQNYPNPFNPITKISWQSPVAGYQSIKVYDVLGNEVATLVDEYKPAGSYEVDFKAEGLSSGIYFYKLLAGNFVESKKMILMK